LASKFFKSVSATHHRFFVGITAPGFGVGNGKAMALLKQIFPFDGEPVHFAAIELLEARWVNMRPFLTSTSPVLGMDDIFARALPFKISG
jgi:hypothetical protein